MKFTNTILFIFIISGIPGWSQCAMCRAVLESEESGLSGVAVNEGIVYLMVFPYLLVGIGGYLIYRLIKKKNKNIT